MIMTTTVERPVKRSGRVWRWILAGLLLAFIAWRLPNYWAFDREQALSRNDSIPWHYVTMSLHVILGSAVYLTGLLQLSPQFRKRYPVMHRWVGRTYVCVALSAGLLALAVGVVSEFGPAVRVGNVLFSLLWLHATAEGWLAARRRRFAEHRVWMLRSFGMALGVPLARVITIVCVFVLGPPVPGGNSVAIISTWLSFTLAILMTQAYLDRPVRRLPVRKLG
ncbi:DUF2306 domain-containing protein [Pseudonocardiaceae bacterium YIM PH 21723]|nr:DUF2306 domain-containing protein [Pseudonocardiaceae bacterium YIM PH 21723]